MSFPVGAHRPRAIIVVVAVMALATLAIFATAGVDTDSSTDLAGLFRSLDSGLAGLRWPFAIVVVGLTGLHYLASAVAARTAAGTALPLGETVLVQLAAASANRIAPGGIGGAAVNARYFACRGLDARSAIGAVAVLAGLGALADILVFLLIITVGRQFGLGGGGGELRTLATHVARLTHHGWLIWVLPVVVALAAVAAVRFRRRAASRPRGRFSTPLSVILRRPRSLANLMTASGATTLILGFAFVATNSMVPGPQPQASVGAVLIAYMAASALGNAVPLPSGLGSTEAAMVTTLVAAHVPTAHAIGVVLSFRIITFWSPAVLGLAAGWHLRRSRAL